MNRSTERAVGGIDLVTGFPLFLHRAYRNRQIRQHVIDDPDRVAGLQRIVNRVFPAVLETCGITEEVPPPSVLLVDDKVRLNARGVPLLYPFGSPSVIIRDAFTKEFDEDEQEWVIAHELGHVAQHDFARTRAASIPAFVSLEATMASYVYAFNSGSPHPLPTALFGSAILLGLYAERLPSVPIERRADVIATAATGDAGAGEKALRHFHRLKYEHAAPIARAWYDLTARRDGIPPMHWLSSLLGTKTHPSLGQRIADVRNAQDGTELTAAHVVGELTPAELGAGQATVSASGSRIRRAAAAATAASLILTAGGVAATVAIESHEVDGGNGNVSRIDTPQPQSPFLDGLGISLNP